MTVPSVAMTQGDFSGAGADGTIPQLYNPFDVVDGQRQPFNRKQIPRSLWNPVTRKLMELIPPPAPNVSGVTAKNHSFARTNDLQITKYSIRGDHHFAGGDTLFGRFSWQDTPARNNFRTYPLPGADLNGGLEYGSNVHHGWQSAIGWVNPVGPNLVGELNVSLWDFSWRRFIPVEGRDWAQELGYDDAHLHPVYNQDGSRGLGGLPTVTPSGYSQWLSAWNSDFGDKGLGLKYSVSWRKGNHYLKFGAEHTRNLDVTFSENLNYGAGEDLFDAYATGQILRDSDGTSTGSEPGESWADFMLGLPSWVVGNNRGLGYAFGRYNQSHYNAFINDDWKVGPNLTLNLGLRWEQPRPPYYEGSPDGRFPSDYQYCAFDFSRGSDRIDPVQLMPRDFDIAQWQGPTGLAIPFENLPRRGCYEAKWSYFSPRFGLAWRLFGTNRTVLRLGAGLNYDQDIGILKVRSMIPALGRLNSIGTRGFETPTIFTGQRLDLPAQVSQGEYRTCYFSELDWEEGHIYSYNLSIQHEVFQGTKLEIGYVGNQGRHMRGIGPFNVAMPEGYVVPLIGGGTAALSSDPITAGPRPWIPGDTADRVWSGQRARRPYPQVVPDAVRRSDRNSNYNSLQAKLERRFQGGVALTLGYIWAKAMALNFNGGWGQWTGAQEYERHLLKGPMAHDRAQTFYNSTIWQLPFFRASQGLTRTLLGGWEATAIITLTTGAPYIIDYRRDLWNQGRRVRLLPDRIGDGYLAESERSVDRWFETSAFVAPVYDSSLCQGTDICHEAARRALGNSARSPLRYDGVPLVDISLHKEFAFGEQKAVDFRVDFFNAFNHSIFHSPNGNLVSSSAGRVTQAATARQIQFGFRFSF